MPLNFSLFPVAPMLLSLAIPITYCLKWNRKGLKGVLLISLCCLGVVVFYPLTSILGEAFPIYGYAIAKAVLFMLFPVMTILLVERWKISEVLVNLGFRQDGISRSVVYGLLAVLITAAATILASSASSLFPLHQTVLFFEAITEEFFFRGFLLIYLLRKTSPKAAYLTSVLAFVLAHPQHFLTLHLIPLILQGVLLALVAYKTKNIIGTWLSHGLNRTLPSLIRVGIGL